ncbi:hypothetical protein BuS5_03762 [Desulfosarcina sp. BuS5]|uniref:trehalase family glycosidase n=1 Tax=Desulfosarcina sp. BuS5 TaxID=933262 RepID=UPI0006849157|nr:trehalase family glycosidase [Desulfosarcina sp. BuS5]WDN90791.1 hypothetical protein BuS5_03762 [Desulfosarcina sp. BuS5]
MNLKNRSLACIACIISYVNMLLLIFCVLVYLGISCTCAFCSPEYSAQISFVGKTVDKYDFERITIPIMVKNTGSKTWDSFASKGPVFISYHLLSGDNGKMLIYDNIRTPFRQAIASGTKQIINLNVQPLQPGKYILQIDLVAEGVIWFNDQGTKPLNVPLNIIQSPTNISKPKYKLKNFSPDPVWYVEGMPDINYCSLLSEKTLEDNFLSFKFKSIPVYGFAAGSGYPQIWIRDSATIMPAARCTHTESELISWIMAHLTIQKQDGELQDWIMANGKFGKNTVESDQESSLIIAAYEISKTIGYKWLQKDVGSKSILLRLNDALNFLFVYRLDLKTGLIKSGYTADWGDVSNEFPDQRAVDLQKGSSEVVGIYTNALAFGAAEKLSFLFDVTGNKGKATYWKTKASALRNSIQRNLWQENKGFFCIHQHVDGSNNSNVDERNIFPMGGNAVAIEMGVATPVQIKRIIDQAVYRQQLFNFSTISGVLLPPYPKDFFKHPALDDYFEYQNGGQWDWFGGRLVLQMFINNRQEAFNKLEQICHKAFLNKGFFEWDTMDGKGQGSSHYSGSAASIYRSVVEGLFGIDWNYKQVRIQPRLSHHTGYIYVPQIENKRYLSYIYKCKMSPNSDKLYVKFSFGSNLTCPITLVLPKSYNNNDDDDNYNYACLKINGKLALSNAGSTFDHDNMIRIDLNEGQIELVTEYKKISK